MNRPLFTLIVIAVIVLALLGMWIAWRARARRDSGVRTAESAPAGEVLESFAERVLYVSTTPADDPLARVSIPGLRYRGYACLTVRTDGVTLEVVGEEPVHFAAEQILGYGSAGRRAGKAVESGGLALLRWSADGRELESSFRFTDRADQVRFAAALERVGEAGTGADTGAATHAQTIPNAASQEDEK